MNTLVTVTDTGTRKKLNQQLNYCENGIGDVLVLQIEFWRPPRRLCVPHHWLI